MDNQEQVFLDECAKVSRKIPFDMSEYSSIGVGGQAEGAYFPEDITTLLYLVDGFEKFGIPYAVLGNMTNTLPPDRGTKKTLVFMKNMRFIGMGDSVFCLSGTNNSDFLDECEKNGRTGAEFLEGIPGTIGGAVYMNAGASGKHIEDILENVLIFEQGDVRTISLAECGYAYKESAFMHKNSVILGASFGLGCGTKEEVAAARAEFSDRRKNLPAGKSMGCIFKNPLKVSAGKLIEGAGLKGMRIGGAVVSDQHANFIINDRNSTSRDIKSLINLIKNAVFSQYGVMLEEEIRYLE